MPQTSKEELFVYSKEVSGNRVISDIQDIVYDFQQVPAAVYYQINITVCFGIFNLFASFTDKTPGFFTLHNH